MLFKNEDSIKKKPRIMQGFYTLEMVIVQGV